MCSGTAESGKAEPGRRRRILSIPAYRSLRAESDNPVSVSVAHPNGNALDRPSRPSAHLRSARPPGAKSLRLSSPRKEGGARGLTREEARTGVIQIHKDQSIFPVRRGPPAKNAHIARPKIPKPDHRNMRMRSMGGKTIAPFCLGQTAGWRS